MAEARVCKMSQSEVKTELSVSGAVAAVFGARKGSAASLGNGVCPPAGSGPGALLVAGVFAVLWNLQHLLYQTLSRRVALSPGKFP